MGKTSRVNGLGERGWLHKTALVRKEDQGDED